MKRSEFVGQQVVAVLIQPDKSANSLAADVWWLFSDDSLYCERYSKDHPTGLLPDLIHFGYPPVVVDITSSAGVAILRRLQHSKYPKLARQRSVDGSSPAN